MTPNGGTRGECATVAVQKQGNWQHAARGQESPCRRDLEGPPASFTLARRRGLLPNRSLGRSVLFYETAWVRRLGARALACGDRVCFDRSRFNPDTAPGRRLIIHELAHVVQQRWYRAGRLSWRETALVDDPILEAEAEAAAKRFLQGRSAPKGCRRASAQTDESGAVIQCQKWGPVGRSWLKVPPSDYAISFADQSSWNEAKGEVQEGKATEYRGIFALYNPTWDGRGKLSQNIARNRESKPPDSVKVVEYNSTATENELRHTCGRVGPRFRDCQHLVQSRRRSAEQCPVRVLHPRSLRRKSTDHRH